MKTIYVASFFESQNWGNGGFYSIARFSPKFFTGKDIPFLFPPWSIINQYKKDKNVGIYTEVYSKILDSLFPGEFMFLEEGDTLLCWEKKGDFCHRLLVADKLEELGFKVVRN